MPISWGRICARKKWNALVHQQHVHVNKYSTCNQDYHEKAQCIFNKNKLINVECVFNRECSKHLTTMLYLAQCCSALLNHGQRSLIAVKLFIEHIWTNNEWFNILLLSRVINVVQLVWRVSEHLFNWCMPKDDLELLRPTTLNITEYYWILLNITEHYWTLLNITEHR